MLHSIFCRLDIAKICKKYGMKKTELNIFVYLSKASGKNRGSDICNFLNLNKGYLSHVLEELCVKGYLEAVPDKDDRRYIHYNPTELAKPMMEDLMQTKSRLDARMLAGITEEEFQVLERVSVKIEQNVQDMLKNGL